MKILFAKFALKPKKNDCIIFLHTSSISQSVQFFPFYGHKLCNFSTKKKKKKEPGLRGELTFTVSLVSTPIYGE